MLLLAYFMLISVCLGASLVHVSAHDSLPPDALRDLPVLHTGAEVPHRCCHRLLYVNLSGKFGHIFLSLCLKGAQ